MKAKHQNSIYYILGVSGSGKTTIGKLLAKEFNISFYDADDFHPEANIQKMQSGQALNDEDRQGWLEAIRDFSFTALEKESMVIACSALKEKYRKVLTGNQQKNITWIYLDGSFDLIDARMKARTAHFMPAALLRSQFEALEIPEYGIHVSIQSTPSQIVQNILNQLNK